MRRPRCSEARRRQGRRPHVVAQRCRNAGQVPAPQRPVETVQHRAASAFWPSSVDMFAITASAWARWPRLASAIPASRSNGVRPSRVRRGHRVRLRRVPMPPQLVHSVCCGADCGLTEVAGQAQRGRHDRVGLAQLAQRHMGADDQRREELPVRRLRARQPRVLGFAKPCALIRRARRVQRQTSSACTNHQRVSPSPCFLPL